jgi:hypothetical protein
MNAIDQNAAEIRPDLVRRTCGGWLAIAPNTALVHVGVTASTEDEAKEKFRFVYNRWIEILSAEST